MKIIFGFLFSALILTIGVVVIVTVVDDVVIVTVGEDALIEVANGEIVDVTLVKLHPTLKIKSMTNETTLTMKHVSFLVC